jgi:hypothetical protein
MATKQKSSTTSSDEQKKADEQARQISERTRREAEEGTGDRKEQGYAGSGDSGADNGNRNLDPDQSSVDQQRTQR